MYMNNEETNKRILKIGEELLGVASDLGMAMDKLVFRSYKQMDIKRMAKATYYHKLKKFQGAGLLKKVRKGRETNYVPTEKVKTLQLKPVVKTRRTDGLSTIIIFDIPETKHVARNTLRRFILRNGYIPLQKSAFISQLVPSQELMEMIVELDLGNNVTFLSGKIDRLEI